MISAPMTARSGAKTLLSASHTSVTTPRGDTIAPCVLLGQRGNRLGRAVATNALIWRRAWRQTIDRLDSMHVPNSLHQVPAVIYTRAFVD